MSDFSEKAQPFLDAIAEAVFYSQAVRDWIVQGTPAENAYLGASALIDEQRAARWHSKPTKQPFWANYWCGRDRRCTCRIEGSKCIESDAIFFFRNERARILAVHVEFKHAGEPFQYGQPEAYPLRAACFVRTHSERRTLNAHHDWTTAFLNAKLTSGAFLLLKDDDPIFPFHDGLHWACLCARRIIAVFADVHTPHEVELSIYEFWAIRPNRKILHPIVCFDWIVFLFAGHFAGLTSPAGELFDTQCMLIHGCPPSFCPG